MKKLYSIYDQITAVYSLPFAATNNNEATRMVANTIIQNDTTLALHPEDYSLYHIGTFNEETGEHSNIQPPELVMKVQTIKQALLHKAAQEEQSK